MNFLSSADVMIVISVVLLIFGFAEIRQYIVETPARVAEFAPVVVILALAADIADIGQAILVNFNPHVPMLAADGAVLPDGRFDTLPAVPGSLLG